MVRAAAIPPMERPPSRPVRRTTAKRPLQRRPKVARNLYQATVSTPFSRHQIFLDVPTCAITSKVSCTVGRWPRGPASGRCSCQHPDRLASPSVPGSPGELRPALLVYLGGSEGHLASQESRCTQGVTPPSDTFVMSRVIVGQANPHNAICEAARWADRPVQNGGAEACHPGSLCEHRGRPRKAEWACLCGVDQSRCGRACCSASA